MEPWVAIGVECVCIEDFEPSLAQLPPAIGRLITRVPMVDEVLTIAACWPDGEGHAALEFVEIPVRVAGDGLKGDIQWSSACFRPLVRHTVESDVALFKALPHAVPA